MAIKIFYALILSLAWSFAQPVSAQEILNRNWDSGKIRGVRHQAYPVYTGFPYLNETWNPGKIEFTDGEQVDSLFLRYSTFKDELIYYNKTVTSQIVIDKASIDGFSFTGPDGNLRVFRKQYYDGFMKGDRFFEILAEGKPDLLVYRKIDLTPTSPYKDASGILKNLEYTNSWQYYFYSREKGYTSVRISQGGLLAKFDKASQKAIKKLLRKSRIRISGEESFIRAWKVIEKEGYQVIF